MSPSISHHGGATGVTGSCHRLQIAPDRALLVDCGLFQGEDAVGQDQLEQHRVSFPVDDVLALIVTHVHIDHIGRLPYLLAAGYRGPILCSVPSARVLPLVIEDALKIGFTRDRALITRFLQEVQGRLVALDYRTWHTVIQDHRHHVRIRLQRAGHILGSAYVEVDICALDQTAGDPGSPLRSGRDDRDNETTLSSRNRPQADIRDLPGKGAPTTRIVFSGDLGAPNSALLPAPNPPERADILVLESTYGDRVHEDRSTRQSRLKAAIDHALENNGTVIVPAFSIGRTQELLYELEDLIHHATDPHWQDLEIIVDSPMAARFTQAYRELKPYWDAEAHQRLDHGRHPLAFDNLYTVDSHEEHLQTVAYLARTGRPAVVIAASGMAAGGRVVNYLKAMLGDERHDVLFVGYQAQGTPGRAIQRFGPRGGWVELDGERIDIRARIHTIGGYSAHADQNDLMGFIQGIPQPPREIRLVHGERDAQEALNAKIETWAQANAHKTEVTLAT
ncbi:MBL fold metallo-hydrolase RNA specificity domain-containing protein [Wenzhouxiangella limi]|uniref:MBL fold metallo-hydrolase n=1 Tax=Wenzhouxiangella limi TaxID=2707351 RepID=A0A845UXZ8_9GAMM|nr:MBL fold metallo-hydrolase [Wenzhouxiangella limi]NDY96297.1 MBL fold metallo-hydrolase [Wenzhouxiangella limi]